MLCTVYVVCVGHAYFIMNLNIHECTGCLYTGCCVQDVEDCLLGVSEGRIEGRRWRGFGGWVHFEGWAFFVRLCFLAGPLCTWRICDPKRSTRCDSLMCCKVGETHSRTTILASPPVREEGLGVYGREREGMCTPTYGVLKAVCQD